MWNGILGSLPSACSAMTTNGKGSIEPIQTQYETEPRLQETYHHERDANLLENAAATSEFDPVQQRMIRQKTMAKIYTARPRMEQFRRQRQIASKNKRVNMIATRTQDKPKTTSTMSLLGKKVSLSVESCDSGEKGDAASLTQDDCMSRKLTAATTVGKSFIESSYNGAPADLGEKQSYKNQTRISPVMMMTTI